MMSETGLQRRRGRASAGPDGTGGGNAGDCGELIARRRELQGEPGTGAIRQRRIGRGKEKKGEISKEESQRKEAPQTQRLRGRRGRLGRGGSRRPGSKWKVDNRERASRARECLDPMDGCWPYRSRGSVFLPRASLPPRHHHRLLHLFVCCPSIFFATKYHGTKPRLSCTRPYTNSGSPQANLPNLRRLFVEARTEAEENEHSRTAV